MNTFFLPTVHLIRISWERTPKIQHFWYFKHTKHAFYTPKSNQIVNKHLPNNTVTNKRQILEYFFPTVINNP